MPVTLEPVNILTVSLIVFSKKKKKFDVGIASLAWMMRLEYLFDLASVEKFYFFQEALIHAGLPSQILSSFWTLFNNCNES